MDGQFYDFFYFAIMLNALMNLVILWLLMKPLGCPIEILAFCCQAFKICIKWLISLEIKCYTVRRSTII